MTQTIRIKLTGKAVTGEPERPDDESSKTVTLKFASNFNGITRLLKTAKWADRTQTKLLLLDVTESQR